jgi:glutamate-1-semialdehyde 2,1-aminomutase
MTNITNNIAGGVNSPVRSFNAVEMPPLIMKKAKGAFIYDSFDNEFLDFCMGWGVHFFGHAYKPITDRLIDISNNTTSFGFLTEIEKTLANSIIKVTPSIEKIRFVNSGTEAVMSAVRLARAFTNRKYIIKFDGCYHGHSDMMLVSAGSGLAEKHFAVKGIPEEVLSFTLSLPYNNTELIENVFVKYKNEIAAIIIEPVAGNMGIVNPSNGFLNFIRDITLKNNTLLIFDEVLTGFRSNINSAQGDFFLTPDLTIFGKVISGGLPFAAYGGRGDVMDLIAPSGSVYQAGTFAGNFVSVNIANEILNLLNHNNPYLELNNLCFDFYKELKNILPPNVSLNYYSSMFTVFFNANVGSYKDALASDKNLYIKFFKYLLDNKILLSPSPFEANFISCSHTPRDLEYLLKIIYNFFKINNLK